MSSLDYLRGIKEIKVTKDGISEDWLRKIRSRSKSEIRIQAIIDKRNRIIRSLHAYYKFSISELVFMFKLSKSAICGILHQKEKWGRTKLCSVCQEVLHQGSLSQCKWEIKEYCSKKCYYKARYQRRKKMQATTSQHLLMEKKLVAQV